MIEILKTATKQRPTGPLQVLLGKMLMKAKMYEDAVQCFDGALLTMKPQNDRIPWPKDAAEVNYLRGMCYGEVRNFTAAHDALNQAIAINGKLADVSKQSS